MNGEGGRVVRKTLEKNMSRVKKKKALSYGGKPGFSLARLALLLRRLQLGKKPKELHELVGVGVGVPYLPGNDRGSLCVMPRALLQDG